MNGIISWRIGSCSNSREYRNNNNRPDIAMKRIQIYSKYDFTTGDIKML